MPRGEKLAEYNRARATLKREAQLTNYDVLENGCWKWRGSLDKDGYGKLKRKGFKGGPQHLMYVTHVGPTHTRGEDDFPRIHLPRAPVPDSSSS